MNKTLENAIAAATVVGLPAFLIALVQLVKPVLPWHALGPALVIALFLLVQGCAPWRHRQWTDERLADVKRAMHMANVTLFCLFFAIAASILLAAYVWSQAPHWIEIRLENAIQGRRVSPVAIVNHASAVGGTSLPDMAVAAIPSPQLTQDSQAATDTLSLYPTSSALAAAIGSTYKFSDHASNSILIQAIFVLFLTLGERIAEVRVKNNPGEGAP